MKKKLLILFFITTLALTLTACNNKEQEEKISSLETEISELKDGKKKVEAEFVAYKEKMKPFEELEKAEAEKKLAEVEAGKKAKAEAEAAEKAAAEEAKKAEESKGYDTGITYDQLARTPDDFSGKKVKFSGEVIQVMEGESETQIRLTVDGDYNKVILCSIPKKITENNRVLEDDQITVSGLSMGLYTYKSTMGGEITIPFVLVAIVDR